MDQNENAFKIVWESSSFFYFTASLVDSDIIFIDIFSIQLGIGYLKTGAHLFTLVSTKQFVKEYNRQEVNNHQELKT